ncbi:MAG: peptidoglycan bridge formation glycyltransferase FemA/FemB family protein [Candidatus Paceibacterota bacterium]
MDISEITDRGIWEDFVIKNDTDSFLHSWNWGEFNKDTGEKIWRLGVFNLDKLAAVALVIKIKARRGTFLFVPHGPIIAESQDRKAIIKELKEFLVKLGKGENAAFIRISPIFSKNEENLQIFQKLDFKDAPVHMMHPETTWILDIQKDEEKLLLEMKKNHRNLIRRAEKDGVEIVQGDSEEFLKKFYAIHMETVQRHHFVPFSYEYIKAELEAFQKDRQIGIFNAKYQGKIISSAIVVFYGNEAFYHHGASSSEYSKVPSSYLALWTAILEAKKRGIEKFNFYGIVENKPKHPWYGLSRFKKGFGGYEENLVHCQDLPLNWKYKITYFIETFRKIKRGY